MKYRRCNTGQQHCSEVTPIYIYDARDRLIDTAEGPADAGMAQVAPAEPAPPPYTIEHDPHKGIFSLRWSDGTLEVFRDKPTRYLVVEPDPDDETGAMKPVLKRGRLMSLHLCREERELR